AGLIKCSFPKTQKTLQDLFNRNLLINNVGFTGALCPPCDISLPTSLYLQMRLTAYNNYGSTNTRCKIIPSMNYSPGGCPFMFVLGSYNSGGKYFIENNILHRSEFNDNLNQNITDVYKLNTLPKLDSNKITIQLKETEHDISYFDQMKLYAIDHPAGTKIGITESNDIVMYYTDDILSSDDAFQNYNGNNITSLIQYGQSIPQVSGLGNSGMYAHFDSLSMNKKLMLFKNRLGRNIKSSTDSLALLGQMGSDGVYNPAYPIVAKDWAGNVSIYTNTDTYIKPFAKRERISDVIIPFSQTTDNVDHVEINFNSDYEMTYFTVTPISYEGFTKTEMPLSEATHSTLGSVLELLGTVDNNMVTMDTTAIVDLKFNYIYPQNPSLIRDYVFVVNGQYNSPNKSTKKPQMSPLANNIHNSFNINYKYKLNPNYPNPFNPVTKINYELEKSGFTKLEVYDVLGRLVDILIKEYKQAGNYTLEFDGSHLSSGVYFYKLQSNDFVDIKRMVLIK
ncbi:MAG: T9SS type A sorting domain-containing protein, partial [Bacteroidetes bacterium]|nr:T9SS type A sorting domain-containing protein [Bacteroidota bacterium]